MVGIRWVYRAPCRRDGASCESKTTSIAPTLLSVYPPPLPLLRHPPLFLAQVPTRGKPHQGATAPFLGHISAACPQRLRHANRSGQRYTELFDVPGERPKPTSPSRRVTFPSLELSYGAFYENFRGRRAQRGCPESVRPHRSIGFTSGGCSGNGHRSFP